MRRMAIARCTLLMLATVLGVGSIAAGCGGDDDDDAAAEGERVAYIHVKPTGADSWESGGFSAVSAMADKYGLQLTEQVVSHDEAPSVLRRLAPEHDLIIAHSSGFGDGFVEVAPEFPDTQFVVFSDLASTEGIENLAAWAINWNEMGYLNAAIACFAATSRGSDTIGHVNSQPIPAFARYGGGAEQATEDFGCNYLDRWTNSFTDTALARQAGLAMIADGADALIGSADAGDQGTRRAVIDRDKLFVTNYSEDDIGLAPEVTITAVFVDFDAAYDEIGDLFTNGQIESEKYPISVQTGSLGLATPFEHVEPEVEEQSVEVFEDIEAGEISVDPERETSP